MNFLETERLILRTWKETDVEPYYQINQDPRVYEFLLGPLSREEVKKFISDQNQMMSKTGYALWALEEKSRKELLGFLGLHEVTSLLPFAPAVEIGWRLGFSDWRKGYATEAAKEVLKYGFRVLNLPEIVSFTALQNKRSQRVMEKIGMKHDLTGDFLLPQLSSDHRLAQHVLYRIKKEDWEVIE